MHTTSCSPTCRSGRFRSSRSSARTSSRPSQRDGAALHGASCRECGFRASINASRGGSASRVGSSRPDPSSARPPARRSGASLQSRAAHPKTRWGSRRGLRASWGLSGSGRERARSQCPTATWLLPTAPAISSWVRPSARSSSAPRLSLFLRLTHESRHKKVTAGYRTDLGGRRSGNQTPPPASTAPNTVPDRIRPSMERLGVPVLSPGYEHDSVGIDAHLRSARDGGASSRRRHLALRMP